MITKHNGNEKVEPGIYFAPREIRFTAIDEPGALPGDANLAYFKVPAIAMLVVGPVVGLVYAIFLPLIGFLMLGALLAKKLGAGIEFLAAGVARSLSPVWQPARAFLARGRKHPVEPVATAGHPDSWEKATRDELEDKAKKG